MLKKIGWISVEALAASLLGKARAQELLSAGEGVRRLEISETTIGEWVSLRRVMKEASKTASEGGFTISSVAIEQLDANTCGQWERRGLDASISVAVGLVTNPLVRFFGLDFATHLEVGGVLAWGNSQWVSRANFGENRAVTLLLTLNAPPVN